MKKNINTFLLDTLIWSYIAQVSFKIIYEKIILDIRYPEFSWNQPVYALVLGILIALISMPFRKRIVKIMYALLIMHTFIAGFIITQFSFKEFFSASGLLGAKRIFAALLKPNWNIFSEGLFAAIETIYMAFIATTLAIPFALVLAFFASKNFGIKKLIPIR